MKRRANLPVLVKHTGHDHPYLRIGEVAVRCRTHPGLVHRFVRLGLVDPIDTRGTPEQWLFENKAVPLSPKSSACETSWGSTMPVFVSFFTCWNVSIRWKIASASWNAVGIEPAGYGTARMTSIVKHQILKHENRLEV